MFNLRRLSVVVIPTTIALFSHPALSQVAIDGRGDYYAPSQTWTVLISSLNCRIGPNISSSITTVYSRGNTIESDFKKGDNYIQLDDQGRPWVAIYRAERGCYVRANSQFIRPNGSTNVGIKSTTISSSTVICANEEKVVRAFSQNYSLSICSLPWGLRGEGIPTYYEGRGREGGIRLSLTGFRFNARSTDYFIAVNGDTIYRLTPNELLVTRGNRTIIQEGTYKKRFS